MEKKSLDAAVAALLTIATECASRGEFRLQALRWLEREVGFDGAYFARIEEIHTPNGQAPSIANGWNDHAERFSTNPTRYLGGLLRILDAAARNRGAVVDNHVFSRDERHREPLYTELLDPIGTRVLAVGRLQIANHACGIVLLGRQGSGARYRAAEIERLRSVLPILALGDAVHARPRTPAVDRSSEPPLAAADPKALAPREREVLAHLGLGLTYEEIARALGISVNTVREYVRRLYDKLGIASRTEAVLLARSLLD
jgi:DNA-binding CsgD family transcriptional regulator